MSALSPFTGFGDDTNTSVKFGLQRANGRLPDWEGGPKLTFHDIANSDRQVTQRHGRTPWSITIKLWFGHPDDLEAMDALQDQRATLRYLYGLTKRAGGTPETILGTRYLALPNTMLISLEPLDHDGVATGPREAMATFRRAYSGGDTFGFARFAEDVT
jgi:hypothetical protein